MSSVSRNYKDSKWYQTFTIWFRNLNKILIKIYRSVCWQDSKHRMSDVWASQRVAVKYDGTRYTGNRPIFWQRTLYPALILSSALLSQSPRFFPKSVQLPPLSFFTSKPKKILLFRSNEKYLCLVGRWILKRPLKRPFYIELERTARAPPAVSSPSRKSEMVPERRVVEPNRHPDPTTSIKLPHHVLVGDKRYIIIRS